MNFLARNFLAKAAAVDELPNGVQLKGTPQVSTIALGVSCSPEFLAKAVEAEAQMVICHHGLHVAGDVYKGRFDAIEGRLKTIIKNDLSLAGYHYALDAHPEFGNNAQLIKKLDAHRMEEPFFAGWGFVAEFGSPISVDELVNRCHKLTKHEVIAITAGPKKIRRIGVCSGGAKPHGPTYFEIIDKKLDAIISGEIGESGPATAQEGRYHYLACGHHATETFGVIALCEKLIDRFGIDVAVKFIDTENPL
jgi:dinuclear metal center YbgI/SA1388 family protein